MNSKVPKNSVFYFQSDKISCKSIWSSKGRQYFVEGYVSTGDIDLVNDIVTKDCMEDMFEQFGTRTIKLDFEHESFRGNDEFESQLNKTKIPLGKAEKRETDEKGLKVTWELNPNWKKFDEKGNIVMNFAELWENVEGGFYDAFSIAYMPVKTATTNVKGVEARLLDKVNLFNVALTGNPVNTTATMTAVMAKSLEWLKNKEGEKMPEKKDEPTEPTEPVDPKEPVEPVKPADPEPTEPAKPDEGADAGAEAEKKAKEVLDKDMIEIKSRLDKVEKKNVEIEKENKELKDFIEKARHKAIGAEDKSKKVEDPNETKSIGPIDFI